jgi:hypothetical protein
MSFPVWVLMIVYYSEFKKLQMLITCGRRAWVIAAMDLEAGMKRNQNIKIVPLQRRIP